MTLITPAQLAAVAPKADPKIAAAILNHADDVLPRYGLATRARLTDFMAHALVESAYFTTCAENLNYSATRLMEVWPSRFPTLGSCAGFAHVPEALACKVYNGRMGNNDARDGWTYRGQGLLQITGKDNFTRLAAKLGKTVEQTALHITSEAGMLECAAATYVMLGAPAHADMGDILATTRCINGGTNGLADRKAMLAKCQNVWPTVVSPTPELDLIIHTIADRAAEAGVKPRPAKAPPVVSPARVPDTYLPPAMVQHPVKPALTFWQRVAARFGRVA